VNLSDRDMRQRGIVPPEKLADIAAVVVGVGAIGRQVALQLAAVGVPQLLLIDFDTVEVENLAAQGFLEADMGHPKVEAVSALCRQINSEIDIVGYNERFKRSILLDITDRNVVIFACVDDMDARKFIRKSSQEAMLFIDGRMAAEVFRVLTVRSKEDGEHYDTTLFTNEEMYEASCTAKSTIYCSNIIAGLMISQLTKFMRGIPIDRDIQFNVLTGALCYDPDVEPVEQLVS